MQSSRPVAATDYGSLPPPSSTYLTKLISWWPSPCCPPTVSCCCPTIAPPNLLVPSTPHCGVDVELQVEWGGAAQLLRLPHHLL